MWRFRMKRLAWSKRRLQTYKQWVQMKSLTFITGKHYGDKKGRRSDLKVKCLKAVNTSPTRTQMSQKQKQQTSSRAKTKSSTKTFISARLLGSGSQKSCDDSWALGSLGSSSNQIRIDSRKNISIWSKSSRKKCLSLDFSKMPSALCFSLRSRVFVLCNIWSFFLCQNHFCFFYSVSPKLVDRAWVFSDVSSRRRNQQVDMFESVLLKKKCTPL